MIGIVYMAREIDSRRIVCLRVNLLETIFEKNLMNAVQTEIDILLEVVRFPYCLQLQDIFFHEKKLIFVYPMAAYGDLHKFSKKHK